MSLNWDKAVILYAVGTVLCTEGSLPTANTFWILADDGKSNKYSSSSTSSHANDELLQSLQIYHFRFAIKTSLIA